MTKRKYFLFDTETGGLDAKSISLLSFFGLILDSNLNIVDDINLMIKPNDGIYRLDIEAMKVNKIDILQHDINAVAEAKAGLKLRDFLYKHSEFATNSRTKIIPAGHNIGRLDIPMGERLIGFEEWNRLIVRRTIDTGTIAQFMILNGSLPETNDCSLKQLCEHYGIEYVGAHTAKQDVFMTLEVLRAMTKAGSIKPCSTANS